MAKKQIFLTEKQIEKIKEQLASLENTHKRIFFTENQVSELQQKIQQAREETDKNPTEGQKSAGNYKMGRVRVLGYDIAIENPRGTIRSGKDRKGNKWQVRMKNDYGYFTHTLGYDGDAVDVFLGDNFDTYSIFAIDQKIDGKFDETKIMLGFRNAQEAKEAYMANYNEGWNGFWKITEVPHTVFQKWLYDGYQQRKPFFEYADIKKEKLNENGLLNEATLEDYSEEISCESILNDFVEDMNQGKETQTWAPLINPSIYQRALQVFTKQGNLDGFPEKYVYQWIGIIMRNTIKLDCNTELAGHSQWMSYDALDNSYINEYIKNKLNMEVMDWDYECTLRVTPQYLINDLLNGRYVLSPNEKEYMDEFMQKNNLSEEAVHQMGPNKGQTAMFLSQPELDYYDNEYMIKTRDKDLQGIIDIYNYHNSGEQECKVSFGLNGDKAELDKDGKILVKMDIFRLLDMVGLYDWMQMPDGSDAWSDFGLRPLYEVLTEYDDNYTSPEQCLVLINKALDVTHQRGDMSSIFIEGGARTLTQISNSGYLTEHYNQEWELEEIEKNQQNGFIKLYHNTIMMNLGDILATGELDIHQHHSEGHGNMLFFTVHPDAWGNECKISIEVPVSEFTETSRFRFVNSDSVITEENIPISEFNFKIEKIQYFDYDRIKEILTGNDMELKEYLLLKYFQEYDYMWWIKQWFLNNLGLKEEDLL